MNGNPAILLDKLKSETYTTFSSYSLSIMPMFLLMGQFATLGGMSSALFKAAEGWLGHRKGGVAMASVGACAGFGAICGSSLATAATMGQVALPELRRYGYCGRVFHRHAGRGRHAGHPDPAFRGAGDLCHPDRAEHRQAVSGGLHPGHPGRHRLYHHDLDLRPAVPRIRGHATAGAHGRTVEGAWCNWPVLVIFGLVVGGIYLGWFTPTEGARSARQAPAWSPC